MVQNSASRKAYVMHARQIYAGIRGHTETISCLSTLELAGVSTLCSHE